MNADQERLLHSDLTDRVLQAFYDVYNTLGSGFLESVYENALVIRLRDDGIVALQQAAIAVYYRDTIVGEFRADLAVDELIELTGIDEEEAKALIVRARAHWFEQA